MKRFIALSLFVAAVFILPACQSSSKTASGSKMLKFNLENGKGYDYEMIINMDQEMGGQKVQMDMSNYYSMDVVADEGGTKTLSTTYDRFKMKMVMAGINIEVDSDKPLPSMGKTDTGEDPMKMMNAILGAIKGRKFTMKVNPEGKILEVTGFADMAKSIADSMNLDPEKREKIMADFNKQFNEKGIMDQFERVLYIFPNKEVKVGDSWQKTTSPGGAMGGKYVSTYTVTEIEGDMVTLEEKSKIDGVSDEMTMNGEITGTIVVDSKTGLVVNADQDMKITAGKDGKSMEIKGKTKIKGKAR
ncbi:MAG: DUF6263 family protein [Chitinophagaceae bacterium]